MMHPSLTANLELYVDDYEDNFYAWTQRQAALLREGKPAWLDWANAAEEIASLGKSDRRALGSHLEGPVMHLLKWRSQPSPTPLATEQFFLHKPLVR